MIPQEFSHFTDADRELFANALAYSKELSLGLKREWDEEYYEHPLRVAKILAENNLDIDTVLAGLLHSVALLENYNEDFVSKTFGPRVVAIINSFKKITGLNLGTTTLRDANSNRKMIFALVSDIRDVFVKLADKLDYLRIAKNFSVEYQKEVAAEVTYIWAPIANRLGMSKIKVELEDLSLKYSNADVFYHIKQLVTLKKNEREEYLEKIQKEIYKSSTRAGIEIVVHTRAKHFYSIYQKMRKKNRTAEELLDLLAVRILCDSSQDCYTLIGLIHSMWKPVDGRFKDFIAVPKNNGYQSIHTTVTVGKFPVEIQIRTHEMHAIAEYGPASHWLYKKGFNKDSVSEADIENVNNLKTLKNDLKEETADFFQQIKNDMLGDSILVFTPRGEIREFPKGSTAIDFAYAVHTRIGQTIIGAKANGKIIPLSRPLETAETIEILTNPQANPTVNQLSSVKTNRAKSKIRAWLHENEPNFEPEKTIPDAEDKTSISPAHRQQRRAQNGTHEENRPQTTLKIRVGDTSNFMVNPANCCKPQYPDKIVGYVSRGRGIILHKEHCPNFENIPHVQERQIAVEWEE